MGPPKRPSPEAQEMQPVCTSGVMRCWAARMRSGTLQCDVVPKLWLFFWMASMEQRSS
jgi:hypothetical protein